MTDMSKIRRSLESGLTVAELIDELKSFDGDARVLFVCDYGDYHHTQQALPIATVDENDTRSLLESAYSRSGIEYREAEHAEYFCPECEQEWAVPCCPKCKCQCVDEEGNPADESSEPETIVVLTASMR